MIHSFRIILFLIVLNPALSMAGNLWGIDYYVFTVRTNGSVKFQNGVFEKANSIQGHFWGGCYNIPVTRNSAFSLGMGMNSINYQKEIQGIFPETGSYGFISISGSSRYWTFPISFVCIQPRNKYSRSTYQNGIRITYVPSFRNRIQTTAIATGGAIQSDRYLNYISDEMEIQHSFLISVTNQVFLGKKAKLCIDPYIGFGSGYFKGETEFISNMSYGLRLSLQFKFPHISFDVVHEKDPRNQERKKLLQQKQKEIEEQLKNKKP